jgi:hypothetical protein
VEKSNLWGQFQSVKNDAEGLKKKGKALAPVLGFIITRKAGGLIDSFKKHADLKIELETEMEIVLEFYAFFMHFINKQSWNILGNEEFAKAFKKTPNKEEFKKAKADFEEKRGIFLKNLCDELTNSLSRIFSEVFSRKVDVKKDFITLLDTRNVEYSKYKLLFPEKGKGSKDTLIWEFSKKIAGILKQVEDIRIIMPIHKTTCDIIGLIQLPELLTSKNNKK